MRICVAGMPLEVQATDTAFFDRRFAAYATASEHPPVMRMTSTVKTHIPPPPGEMYGSVRRVRLVRLPDGRLCYYTLSKDTGEIVQLTRYTPDFSQVDIEIAPNAPHLSATDFEYVYTGYEFSNRLGYCGGAVLHSSAIAYQGQGVAFSAPSGTGKSTHTGLWKQCFGDDVVYINDDKPALRFENEQVTIYGTPWSGKTALNNNLAVPLRAVVFIERGTDNAMRRLDSTEAMWHLSAELVRPFQDEEVGRRQADNMVRLVTAVPMYLLTCNMTPAAAQFARDRLF